MKYAKCRTCEGCEGHGVIWDADARTWWECPDCQGEGKVPAHAGAPPELRYCPNCGCDLRGLTGEGSADEARVTE